MKKNITLITMLLLLAVSFVSCGKKDEPVLPLNVVSVTPLNNATAIDFRPTITINFDKAVDNTTISGIQLLNPAGTPVSSDVTVSAKTVSLVPKVDLDMGTKYTVKVSAVKAVDTGSLAKDVTSTFTTEILYLNVVSVTPTNDVTGVATNSVVTVTFDKDVDKTTLSGIKLFDSKDVQATIDEVLSAKVVTFTLANKALFEAGAKYTIKISGVKGIDGTSVKDFTSTFTTKSVPLTVLITPAHKSVEIPIDSKVTIVFSKKMNSNVRDYILLTASVGDTRWTATFDGDRTVVLTPTAAMNKNMVYYVSYYSGLTSLDGEVFPVQDYYYFQTGSK